MIKLNWKDELVNVGTMKKEIFDSLQNYTKYLFLLQRSYKKI